MPTYITLAKWTDQGIRAVKESAQRLDAARQAIQQAGGQMREFYMAMGEYDLVTIIEAPDDETAAKFALMGMTGSLSITTMRAFTEAEADNLIKGIEPPPE